METILTSHGVLDGLLSLLYAQAELLQLGPQLVAPVVEDEGKLEVALVVHGFCLLVDTLQPA